ncbi:DNA replication/repair protein RecF [Tropicimonas sp.]|uniref:DNA replication/repair protein RecF n=1 Tax=Tropicimonas sp. TaxID=2067044 RepID=UPI003A85A7E3
MAGLFLSSLTLSHFRSHRSVRLAVGPEPVAVFGPNGSGKTNLLEAVSLLSPGRGFRRATTDEMSRCPEGLGWKIGALVGSQGRTHEIATWSEGGSGRQVALDGKAVPQIALGRVVRLVWLVPAMDRLWIEGAEGRRRFLDRMVMSFIPDHAEAVLNYEKAMRERNRLLKDQVRDGGWYGALEARMAAEGAAIQDNRLSVIARIERAQQGSRTAFPSARLALSGPEEETLPLTREDLLSAFSESRRADLVAGRTLRGPHRSDLAALYSAKGVAARLSSTGEQKALLLSLILANARALAEDSGAPPLLLLDEVAAHLDLDRRAALYDEIAALGAQAWMTGTGAELFAELGDRTQRLEVHDTDGTSDIRML